MQRIIRDFKRMVEREGGTVRDLVQAGPHARVEVAGPDGDTFWITLPSSPSDTRWVRNQRSLLRRMLDRRA